MKKTIGMSSANTLKYLINIDSQEKTNRFAELFLTKADLVMADLTHLLKNTRQTIKDLHAEGRKLGIVSTKFRYRINTILEREKLLKYFGVIIGREDVEKPKPAKEGILKAIEGLDETKDNVIYVGDSVIDAQTAMNAGVSFVATLTGTTPKQEFSNYQVEDFITDISELNEILPPSI